MCFGGFLTRFRLPTVQEEDRARLVIDKMAKKALTQFLNRIKFFCIKSYGEDTEMWKTHTPNMIPPAHWPTLRDIFSSDDYRKISEQAKNNRGKNPGHVAGSANVATHGQKLEKKFGRPPTQLEKFDKIHIIEGKYVNQKAATVKEKFQAAITKEYGDDPSLHPSRDAVLWVKTVGKKSHGYYYGMGGCIDSNVIIGGSSSIDSSTVSPTPSMLEERRLKSLE